MYSDDPGVSGKQLIPRLAVGCILFTIVGLLGTYMLATMMSKYILQHPPKHSVAEAPQAPR